MSSRISQWIGLIGIAATIPLVQTVAIAKTPVEIGDIATSITVLITNSSSSGNGSGVILQHQGDVYTVLTVAHVVKKRVSYQITTSDLRSYDVIPSSIRSAPGDIDLAIVKFRARNNYPIATLGNCNPIKLGMSVYVAGFSGLTFGRTKPVLDFKLGTVSSNSYQAQAKGYSLIYDNNTMPGMSGGTVLNSNGELIALHGVGDKELDSGTRTGSNMAIPINRFGEVASSMGVELNGQVAPIPRDTTKTADDYLTSARWYENSSWFVPNYRAALDEYNSAIKLDPNYALAYNKRGNLKSKLKDIQGALADYNQAILLDRNFANPYNNRAYLKVNNFKDFQGALTDYDRAIQLDPNFDIFYKNRANLKKNNFKDFQGALADYNSVIKLNPNDSHAHYFRANLKMNNFKDFQGALPDYDRAIQLDPKYAAAYYERGYLKAYTIFSPDINGALADYDRAIQLFPKYADAYHDRAVLKSNRFQDHQGAIADYDRAIQLFPKYALAFENRARLKYYKLNDRSGAINDMRRWSKLYLEQNPFAEYTKTNKLLLEWMLIEWQKSNKNQKF